MRTIKSLLEAEPALRDVAIRGEVTNYSRAATGNLLFSLKEEEVTLKCFAWSDDFNGFPRFANGDQIVAFGRISTWPPRSEYQLVVRGVRPEGVGDVAHIFEERKRRLAAEGLFESGRKRPLPRFPFAVALVSSRRAEGRRDFIERLRKLRPHVAVRFVETSVQGPNAANEIAGALGRASMLDVDVIVLTRGGGSFEDLFVFSDEKVVRAIAAAKHPVISAIGHTVDQQLSDFVADLHAETPSAAAERIGFETEYMFTRLLERGRQLAASAQRTADRGRAELNRQSTRSKLNDPRLFLLPQAGALQVREERLRPAFERALRRKADRVRAAELALARCDPAARLERGAGRLRTAGERLERGLRRVLDAARRRLEVRAASLGGKDPEAILQRGYAIVTAGGAIVRDARSVPAGAEIEARLARGRLVARVESREGDGDQRGG